MHIKRDVWIDPRRMKVRGAGRDEGHVSAFWGWIGHLPLGPALPLAERRQRAVHVTRHVGNTPAGIFMRNQRRHRLAKAPMP